MRLTRAWLREAMAATVAATLITTAVAAIAAGLVALIGVVCYLLVQAAAVVWWGMDWAVALALLVIWVMAFRDFKKGRLR